MYHADQDTADAQEKMIVMFAQIVQDATIVVMAKALVVCVSN